LLSDLLWAAFGVNRPETGQRTAPSAMDNREIDLIVATEAGAFLFEPTGHALRPLSGQDLRPLSGGQDYVRVAPVSLVYMADHRRQTRVPVSERALYAATDTGFIGQNVYLFCAAEGLASVVHVVPQPTRLAEALGCVPEQQVVLAHCVGYPAAEQQG
jgi:nitroreductase